MSHGGGFWKFSKPETKRSTNYPGDCLRCRSCKNAGVYWKETKKGWRLFEKFTNKLHRCIPYSRHVNHRKKPDDYRSTNIRHNVRRRLRFR